MSIRFSTTLPRGIIALRHRNFRFFWFGQLISLMGTWMQNMAQGWLVLHLTNSPFLLGVLTAIQFLPTILFSLPAGEIADRIPKKRLLIITQCSLLVLALTLGILTWTNTVRYWHILVLAGLLGTVSALDNPTRQSFIVEMVGKKDLMNAIVLNSAAFNGARVVGPALAGLAIGKLGMAPCFLLNAASFLAVLFGLLMINVPLIIPPQAGKVESAGTRILEGLHYIRQTPPVLSTILLVGLVSTLAMNFSVLVPVFAKITLGLQVTGYGFLMSAMGVGALFGAIILAMISHLGPRRFILVGGGIGLCLAQFLLSFSRNYYLSLLLLGLMGWMMITFVASANTTLQANVPNHLRGRVMSVYTMVFLGTTTPGSLISGSIAHIWGAQEGFRVSAVTGLLSILLVLAWERRAHSRNGQLITNSNE